MLINSTAQAISACSWDYRIWMIRSNNADPLYRFVRNGKAGYINQAGKIVIEPKLEFYGNHSGEFFDGLQAEAGSFGNYVDASGKVAIEKEFERAWDFSEGLAVAMPKGGDKWGYINRSGDFVIAPRFETFPKGYVYSFSENLAKIQVGKKYGFIDRTGEFVVEPQFLHADSFRDEMARVVTEGPCILFSTSICPGSQTLGEKSTETQKVSACQFSFINKQGKLISAERFDGAKPFGEGLAPVLSGGKWGYLNKTGEMVIKPTFDEANVFSDGLALVRQNGKAGYINRTGEFVIKPQFEYAEDFSDGLAVIGRSIGERGEEFFYINKNGQPAFAEKFALASHFYQGLAHVKIFSKKKRQSDEDESAGTYAYIDTSGKRVFIYEYRQKD